MELDLDWAIGINRASLKIIGLWPDDKLTRREKFLANLRASIIFVTMFITAVIPGIFALVKVWGDLLAMADNVQISLPFSITVTKFCLLWQRKESLVPIINMVKNDWIKTKTEQERNAMIKQAKVAKAIVMFGCVMMVIAAVLLIIPPIFGYSMRYLTNLTDGDGSRPFLFQTYYLRDMSDSPYYEIIFVFQAIAIIMAAISYTGVDNFLALLVFHICAQLDILRLRMLNLKFKNFNTAIALNIEDHLRLVRSIDVIDNAFNLMLLALLVFFTIIFCVQGFLLVCMLDGNGGDITFVRLCWLVSVTINIFVHMCLYCVVGEILIAKGEGVYYAAYNYAWYLLKPSEARNMLMIMIRSEKPLLITAGGMFPMTLSMFCSLIKTSAGYISVLMANR